MRQKVTVIALLSSILILSPCSNWERKSGASVVENSDGNTIILNDERSTFLYCTKASAIEGKLEASRGRRMPWKGNAKLEWEVEVPAKEKYELYLIANVREGGVGERVKFKTDKNTEDVPNVVET